MPHPARTLAKSSGLWSLLIFLLLMTQVSPPPIREGAVDQAAERDGIFRGWPGVIPRWALPRRHLEKMGVKLLKNRPASTSSTLMAQNSRNALPKNSTAAPGTTTRANANPITLARRPRGAIHGSPSSDSQPEIFTGLNPYRHPPRPCLGFAPRFPLPDHPR